jgi:hypothetical protein
MYGWFVTFWFVYSSSPSVSLTGWQSRIFPTESACVEYYKTPAHLGLCPNMEIRAWACVHGFQAYLLDAK